MAAKKKKKLKLRVDRVIIAAVACLIILFGLYKGISFAVSHVMSLFETEAITPQKNDKPKNYKATVIVDPGHGGYDVGANIGELYEKDISLTTAKAVAKELDKADIKAILTRNKDEALHDNKITDLKLRCDMSKENQAKYFVSIHVNDYDKTTNISGFEIYTKNKASEALATSIGNHIEKLNYSKNRGMQDGNSLAVLRDNSVSSVLIELGYIRGKDFDYLNDNQKLEKIGQAIAQGIIENIN
ncbi:N-acetylmuramoyl-L-alanine amidase [Longibaculum muris]|uniref:N-acetylmuramoyl-L-alanine amidase family protein n=1 Tax=Longibaculum muris TaxID=1796628 RepID=UPI00189D33EC|nr:N-acetylmuramoyl-L-alanine amidase [Longibaculum muris]